ncbi:adenosylmethionine decarboxylase [Flavobacterium branchiophilum NBRC 15030 = ATCC 35035]|uniref:S-adenosylmethionine decarboxylase n=1 Tax=Flavobacterium branchiophilum TaxID=55197 RepID=A0A543G4L1_9FLAO|nr:S-adenosylmethionine decarboxylase [Flavobacterium branchiophilum]OXA69808.1 adenosylmethionine decarboxylase [Flavobacterium branchiophilum NBRC 15030 = ATCC 35035]TQM41026.1 S-adenosylmethionine decarboxylase [Flavobacterium branchiophilum]GEM54694.1 hypothetical protein FB1_09150 [Flavobacterium branchiophilum NBRC 15030 = ATCC 35035]
MNTIDYSPGLHKLLTLHVKDTEKLINSAAFQLFTDAILLENNLHQVGIVLHHFENESFTIAVCLKESHICMHTWPEFNQLTLDIYLCNYQKDNSHLVQSIAQKYTEYFEATIIKDIEINR